MLWNVWGLDNPSLLNSPFTAQHLYHFTEEASEERRGQLTSPKQPPSQGPEFEPRSA